MSSPASRSASRTAPCGAGATVAAVTAFTPDRELSWQEKQQRDAQWATRRNPAPTSAAAVVPAAPVRAVDHCAIARRERDAWERSAGLNRTYDAVRRWNDHVARACN